MRSVINISLPASLAAEVKKDVKEGHFASTSEFFRHVLRLWSTEKLAQSIKKAEIDWKKGRNWKELKTLKDLR